MPTEKYAIVLDYLPEGKAGSDVPDYKKEKRVTQTLGKDYFSPLEVALREGYSVSAGDELYIGKGTREKVHHIIRRLKYKDLTSTAQVEFEYAVGNLVEEQEEKFVKWFNECGSLTTRLHRLELLPGVGKKHMWDIKEIREEEPFKSFEDIAERVPLLPEPKKLIVKRIIMELKGEDEHGKSIKYRIFAGVKMFPDEEEKKSKKKKSKKKKGKKGKKKEEKGKKSSENKK